MKFVGVSFRRSDMGNYLIQLNKRRTAWLYILYFPEKIINLKLFLAFISSMYRVLLHF